MAKEGELHAVLRASDNPPLMSMILGTTNQDCKVSPQAGGNTTLELGPFPRMNPAIVLQLPQLSSKEIYAW